VKSVISYPHPRVFALARAAFLIHDRRGVRLKLAVDGKFSRADGDGFSPTSPI